ncbi:DUF55-domain-containing protein [Lentinus tigrinus ALCF2SS1-7]|nr:DUF55-domain-containing protein [Lentinus tigrinus ALCF2SS1-7]
MKAEPDSRIVKGKDVKFSVDDFEAVKTTPWEGVRNAEARNLMKEMAVGDKVLFYHSNCKNPGIAGFAEVSKEAYPDYTAWDSAHPYYDAKTDKDNPKWHMVDVTFVSRAKHFVPLSLLRTIASSTDVPEDVSYIGEDGAQAIKGMALVTRGRLSVQRVEGETWRVIEQLAERGGWDEGGAGKQKTKAKTKTNSSGRSRKKAVAKKDDEEEEAEADGQSEGAQEEDAVAAKPTQSSRRKRKIEDTDAADSRPRRSTRARR